MNRSVFGVIWAFITLCFFCVSAHAAKPRADARGYTPGKTFNVPADLDVPVEFWKKIYTRYSTKQSVLHDNKHLHIIYTVLDFSDLYKNPELSEREIRSIREQKTEAVKQQYRRILDRLHQFDMEEIPVRSLSVEEKQVLELFAGVTEEYRFERSMGRIRAQVGQRDEFIRGIIDSGAYLPEMEDIFSSYGLPIELTRLPFVESMFNTKAYSKAHASGVWQFIKPTGKLYLRIDNFVDERNDPILATHAAARLLMTNYDSLLSWPLAVTAYNHGRAGMSSAVRQTGEMELGAIIARYQSPSFGFASRNFYAQFLAALQVEKNHRKYFGPLVRMEPVLYDVANLATPITLKALSEYSQIPEDELIDLNPAWTESLINSQAQIPKNWQVRIPRGQRNNFNVAMANIPKQARQNLAKASHWHRIQDGENLTQIAKRYNIGIRELQRLNGVSKTNRIYAGQLLKIPSKAESIKLAKAATAPPPRYPQVKILPLPDEAHAQPQTPRSPSAPKAPIAAATPAVPAVSATPTPLSPTEAVAKNIVEETSKTPPPQTIPAKPPGLNLDSQTLFAALDADNSDKVFSLSESTVMDPEKVAWNFHDVFQNPKAPKDVPFVGSTLVIDDETPGHFAEWCGISTPQFRRLNHMKYGQSFTMGRRVKLECLRTFEDFQRVRLAYHQQIQKDYLAACQSLDLKTHELKSEESLWSLSKNQYSTPLWLIQLYNPSLDLTQTINPGERLKIPVCQKSPSIAKGEEGATP